MPCRDSCPSSPDLFPGSSSTDSDQAPRICCWRQLKGCGVPILAVRGRMNAKTPDPEAVGMPIIRALRSLLLIVASALALAIGVAAVAAVEVLLLATVAFWSPHACTTTVHQRIAGLSNFDFEIRETGCDLFAKDATTSVFISKAGGTKKALLFKYFSPGSDAMPTIVALDEHTVQISIWRVPIIFCRRGKWETLTVKYNIGVVDYPFGGTDGDC